MTTFRHHQSGWCLESVSKFRADTKWDSELEAGSAELHTHHLADRKPSRPNSPTIDKLLLNFKLPRYRVMKDEVGEGRGEKEGKHHLSQLNRNWLSPSREGCEGWDWLIWSLPRGGVCTVCVSNTLPRWTRNTAEHETRQSFQAY